MSKPLYGAIEAGGTKFVCAVGRSPETLSEPCVIATADPATTLAEVVAYFRRQDPIAAFGIATFGPADVNPHSPRFGTILQTPKPGWSNVDLRGAVVQAFGVPVGFDTDVNGAVLAELAWGAARGARVAAYVTVGTGIGAGLCFDGMAVCGQHHPEAGHIFPVRHAADREFAGVCPFHGDCMEGLASGPAIMKRWGVSLSQLPPDHVAHDIIAHYLAQLAISLVAVGSADVIVFGGGVLGTPGLLERIRQAAAARMNGYWAFGAGTEGLIRAPGLGTASGLCGALLLSQRTAGYIADK